MAIENETCLFSQRRHTRMHVQAVHHTAGTERRRVRRPEKFAITDFHGIARTTPLAIYW